MYDADGNVAVQIMCNPRPEFAANTMGFPTPKDVQIAYKGYYAYYGTYTIDTGAGQITHHLREGRGRAMWARILCARIR